jgi:hypothetical protein
MEMFPYKTVPTPPEKDAGDFAGRACLVAGSAKSGTTLLVALLDGHPALLPIPEETAYFPTVRRKYRHASRKRQAAYLMEEAESRLLFEKEARDYGNRDYRNFPRGELRAEFLRLAEDPARKGVDLLALLAESLAKVEGRDLGSLRWWIEKTPANRWCFEDIRTVFPQGRIILTMRDPRAVTAAIIQRARKKNDPRFSLYLCVKFWLQSARLAWQQRNSSHVLVVRFEDLLREPEASMRRVCAFLGVDFTEDLTRPTKAGVAWKGNSTGGTGFRGIDTAPIDRWKETLQPNELAFVERLAGPWMQRFDYPPMGDDRSAADVWRKQPLETWRGWGKDRRRWLGDSLKGFWKLDP